MQGIRALLDQGADEHRIAHGNALACGLVVCFYDLEKRPSAYLGVADHAMMIGEVLDLDAGIDKQFELGLQLIEDVILLVVDMAEDLPIHLLGRPFKTPASNFTSAGSDPGRKAHGVIADAVATSQREMQPHADMGEPFLKAFYLRHIKFPIGIPGVRKGSDGGNEAFFGGVFNGFVDDGRNAVVVCSEDEFHGRSSMGVMARPGILTTGFCIKKAQGCCW